MNKRELIESVIVNMIREHILNLGDSIPAIRKISKLYNVSTTPVIDAYHELEQYGIIESRPRSGFVVVSDDFSSLPEILLSSEQASPNCVIAEVVSENPFSRTSEVPNLAYDFGGASISSTLIPMDELSQRISRSLRMAPEQLDISPYGYDDCCLLDAISKYMLQNHRIMSKQDICIINNDITTALTISIKTCTAIDQSVLVISPCSNVQKYSVGLAGRRATYVPCLASGTLNFDILEAAVRENPDAAALLISTDFQMLFGNAPDDASKQRLISICQENNITIIEDDSCGDLYFSGSRPLPLKSIAPDNVIYISSFSTSIAPSLQLHWVCPGKFEKAFRHNRNNISSTPPAFIQNGFADYMQSKQFKKHMDSIRNLLCTAMNSVREMISSSFPDGTVTSTPSGGFILGVTLPETIPVTELHRVAAENGIFFVSSDELDLGENSFAINFSSIAKFPEKLLGIMKLGNIASEVSFIPIQGKDRHV